MTNDLPVTNDLKERYRRNAAWLHAHHPGIWHRVAACQPQARLVYRDGHLENLRQADGTLLYPEDAAAHARKQVAAFLARPPRLTLGSPAYCNLSPVSFTLLDRLLPLLEGQRLAPLPVVDAGFLFVFGIGLGLHLPALLRAVPCRDVVLIETSAERLRTALLALDLPGLAALAAERGKTLRLILEEAAPALQAAVERAVLETGNTFLDGSWLFQHTADPMLRDAVPALATSLRTLAMSHGFFEDEMMMLCNAQANLARGPCRLLEEGRIVARPLPALVVASGPSLDAAALATIKELAGRVLVVSCGTTLRILLDNGIRPHLHVEVENNDRVAEHLVDLARSHDLSGITLAASLTVRPSVVALFERAVLFARRPSGVAGLLVPDERAVSWADPTVANAAVVVCALLGFADVTLVGVDFGFRAGQRHHADGSAYFLADYAGWEDEAGYDRLLPAVGGGMVRASWVLELGVRSLEEFLRGVGLRVRNSSDGAAIAGTRVEPLTALWLPPNSPAPAACLADAVGAVAVIEAPVLPAFREARADLQRLLADWLSGANDFGSLACRLTLPDDGPLLPLLRVVRGSLWSLLRLGAYFGTRLGNTADRDAFFQAFRVANAEVVHGMLAEMEEVLAAIAAGRFDGAAAYGGYLAHCRMAEAQAEAVMETLRRVIPAGQ